MFENIKWQLIMGLSSAVLNFFMTVSMLAMFMLLPYSYHYMVSSSFIAGFFWWHMLCFRKGIWSPMRGAVAGLLTGLTFNLAWCFSICLVYLLEAEYASLGDWFDNTVSATILTTILAYWVSFIYAVPLAILGAMLGVIQRHVDGDTTTATATESVET